jgi:membrane protease YdiL (CAAX protease family)
VSSPQNPWSEPGLLPVPEPPPTTTDLLSENPVWSGWDVLQIVLLTIVSVSVFLSLVGVAAQQLLYPKVPLLDVMVYPLVAVLGQALAYLLILAFMVSIVKRVPSQDFWLAIRWNWPTNWATYLMAGVALSFALQGIAHFLPIPKELPMDRFFRTPGEAWALSLFGVVFAPLLEELLFRGFLYPVLVRQFSIAIAVLAVVAGFSAIYAAKVRWTRGAWLVIFIIGLGFVIRGSFYPVLARRFGIAIAVVATAASFGLIHAAQLGWAWGPVSVIFMVGLVLTITRAATKSVAASVIMHVAYNGTLSILLFVGTDGFRHLERLNQ